MSFNLACLEERHIYIYAALISILLSVWAATAHHVINPDAVYYLRAAEFFSDGQWQSGFGIYQWPFYSLVIGSLMKLTGLEALTAAHIVNTTLDAGSIVIFVAVTQQLTSANRKRALFCAAFLILLHPRILQLRPIIIRDHGFLTFFLLALYLVVIDVGNPRIWRLTSIGCSIVLAALFRLEALFLFLLIPGFYFFLKYPAAQSRIVAAICVFCLTLIPGYFVWAGMGGISMGSPSNFAESVIRQASILLSSMGARADQFRALLPSGRNVGELVYAGGVLAITIDTIMRAWSFPTATLTLFAFTPRKLMPVLGSSFVGWFAGWQIPLLLTFTTFTFFLDWRYAMAFTVVASIPAVFTISFLVEEWTRGLSRARILLPIAILSLLIPFGVAFPRPSQLGYLVEAARWAELNVSTQARAITNDGRIAYMSHRSYDNDVVVRPLEIFQQSLPEYQYAIVAIDKGDSPAYLSKLQPIAVFYGKGVSRVIVYKLR